MSKPCSPRPCARRHRAQCRSQGAANLGRPEGLSGAQPGRHQGECHPLLSPSQALLAAKAGAAFISPFVGRLDDISQDGMGLIREIATIYRAYPIPSRPRSWSPRSATRSTSWRPRSSAPMWRRCHRAYCGSSRATRSPTRGSTPSSPTGRRRASRSSHDWAGERADAGRRRPRYGGRHLARPPRQ